MSDDVVVEISNVWKIFGTDPKAALDAILQIDALITARRVLEGLTQALAIVRMHQIDEHQTARFLSE